MTDKRTDKQTNIGTDRLFSENIILDSFSYELFSCSAKLMVLEPVNFTIYDCTSFISLPWQLLNFILVGSIKL